MTIEDQFLAAIAASGLTPPTAVIGDGQFHRFQADGKPGKKNGWYILHTDDPPAGQFGCWSTGLSVKWSSRSDKSMSRAERLAMQRRMQEISQRVEAERQNRQAEAAEHAESRWQQAARVTEHAYLQTKKVKPHGLRQDGNNLLVPLRDENGVIHSLQTLTADGGKFFLDGGRTKGCYHAIGKPDKVLIVCEGYATGASIFEATGYAVAVAFNVGNLEPVARVLQSKYPELKLILAADDDWKTQGNPGLTQAKEAAVAVGCLVAVPTFPANRPDKATDFNDLHQLSGAAAVKACIDAAAGVVEEWPEITPLLESIEPEAYPVDALPNLIRGAVEEVQAFTQAPVAMVATSALASLSMAVQGLYDIKRSESLDGPVSLFCLAIADSGERKTTCDEFFFRPIRKWEQSRADELKIDLERQSAALESWNAEHEGLVAAIKGKAKGGHPVDALRNKLADLKARKPLAIKVPRLVFSDITPEELGYSLANRWPSVAVSSSEAGAVLGSHAMTGDSLMRNLSLWNDLWSGQPIQSDRRTASSWRVRNARLTVGLQVQESTLRAFYEKTNGLARGTGFLARFLVAWPASTQGTRLFKEAPTAWPKLTEFHSRIEAILGIPLQFDSDGATLMPSTMNLSPPAKKYWVEYHDLVEKALAVGGEFADIRDVASKSADNAARLAAHFQVLQEGGGSVSLEAMEMACQIAAWYLGESRRFLGGIALPKELADAMRLVRFLSDYSKTTGLYETTTRHLQRLGHVRDKTRLAAALDELVEHGYIKLVSEGRKKLVRINPKIGEVIQ